MSASPSASSSSGRSLSQNSIYVGVNLQDILYGMELVFYFKTIQVLLRHGGARRRSNLSYALFSSMMVFLTTVWVATSAILGEKMWLLDSNFPGGPDAYFDANISDWYLDWGTTSIIILQLMTDGLLIYRCRIVWNSYRVIIAPVFLWFSTLVLAVLVDWTSSIPGGNFFAGLSSQFALAYYSISVFLNTFLTCMICYRIMRHGKRVREHLGREYASLYYRVATLVVESMVPYTLSGIAFLVSLGVGSQLSKVFLPVYALMMCISPQILIFRVVCGRAWKKDASVRTVSTINFSPGRSSASRRTEHDGTAVQLETLSKAYFPDGLDTAEFSQA